MSHSLKPAESGQWNLYIAADGIGGLNLDEGYREVLRLVGEMPSPYLDPVQGQADRD